jgi:tetratricopeptide (TPR) repeat protein
MSLAVRSAALLLSIASLASCAVNPRLDLREIGTAGADVVELDVPFHAQTDYQCGPASLAGVLAASGAATDLQTLTEQVYLPGRKGTLQVELMTATRRAGRIPLELDPMPQSLVAEIEAGRPVLVLQNLGTHHVPLWHYAVVTGFDRRANKLLLNSGIERGKSMSAPRFLRTWDWGGRWAMVALRPGELPAGADAAQFLESVSRFEAVAGHDAALPAWRAAANRWPGHPGPDLAMGNGAYAAGDLQAAAGYFRKGLKRNPNDPVLANNLASVLGEMGCPRRAEELLRRVAADLGDDARWSKAIAATLAELAARDSSEDGACYMDADVHNEPVSMH